MKLNYRKLGDLVVKVSEVNNEGLYADILGISIEKEFIPTVANTIGTDLNDYNILRANRFAFNPMHVGRDKKLPISVYRKDEPAIVSPAYFMFEMKDKSVDVDYLMLIFKTESFDHVCWFHTDSSIRGGLTWEDFADIEVKIPSIEEQKKIVRYYKIITDRINILEKINLNFQILINNIFCHYFFDYSYLKEVELENTQYGDIPRGWKYVLLGDLCSVITKGTTPTTLGKEFTNKGINFIKCECINNNHNLNIDMFAHIDNETHGILKRSQIKEYDILFSIAGTLGKFVIFDKKYLPANTNQALSIIRVNPKNIDPLVLYSYFLSDWQTEFYKRNAQPGVQDNLCLKTIKNLPILIADENTMRCYKNQIHPIIKNLMEICREINELNDLLKYILHKLN